MRRQAQIGLAIAIAALVGGAGVAAASGAQASGTTCPGRAPARIAAPQWSAARAALAPPGASSVRLCRYSGLNAHPQLALTASTFLRSHATVNGIVWRLDVLPAFPPGAFSCPAGDGSQILAMLGYPGGRAVRVGVELTGCTAASNGAVVRATFGFGGDRSGPSLLRLLERLLR